MNQEANSRSWAQLGSYIEFGSGCRSEVTGPALTNGLLTLGVERVLLAFWLMVIPDKPGSVGKLVLSSRQKRNLQGPSRCHRCFFSRPHEEVAEVGGKRFGPKIHNATAEFCRI